MQMVKKFFVVLLVLWFAIVFFMPKQALYYKFEEALSGYDIKVNEKNIQEGVFSITLHDAKVYVKGIHLATIEKIDVFTLLFYTKIEASMLVLDESLKNMAPTKIDELRAVHAFWNPLNVSLDAQGSFGRTKGNVSLIQRHVRLDFNETKNLEMIHGSLKQDEKGWFYETAF